MKVLALSGWKKSGKDTCASYLIDNYDAVRVSFADPLKDMVAAEYGINRSWLDDPEKKEAPLLGLPVNPQDRFSLMIAEFMVKEFRTGGGSQADFFCPSKNKGAFVDQFGGGQTDYLQLYWTPRALAILKGSGNRSVDSSYWVKKAVQQVKDVNKHSTQPYIVISDLRFKSEMAQLKDAFGSDVVFLRVQRFDSSPSSDPSERDLDDTQFDFYVDNKTTKENAFSQLDVILSMLK